MSRHKLLTKQPDKFSCDVGYDRPLTTFYAQVIDLARRRRAEEARAEISEQLKKDQYLANALTRQAEDDGMIRWVGASVSEIGSVEALAAAIAAYAEIPLEIKEQLAVEKLEAERVALSPLQLKMRRFITSPEWTKGVSGLRESQS